MAGKSARRSWRTALAKRGTLDHPKNKRLARLLGVEPWASLGLLEAVWHWVGRYAPCGFVTAEELADCADSAHFRDDLAQVLVPTGWLDRVDGGFYVHDWHDHADDTVKKTLAKRGETFHSGAPVRHSRTSREPIADYERTTRERLANRSRSDREPFANDSRTIRDKPEPEPEPSQSQKPKPNNPPDPPGGEEGGQFERFWDQYPRKAAKSAALKAWRKLTGTDRETALSRLAAWLANWQTGRESGEFKRFGPHPATWINQRRWEDELDGSGAEDEVKAGIAQIQAFREANPQVAQPSAASPPVVEPDPAVIVIASSPEELEAKREAQKAALREGSG